MKNDARVKYACYTGNISMAIVGNLPPVLFLTFRNLYGISYTLLGTLVLINFVTQLLMDLIFSFFSHKFNIPKTVKFTPILAILGFLLYALTPFLFPNAIYLGLALGTVIFSASSGLCEVLLSPVIAAIPSDNPEREMSKLHSVYAWGAVGVILVSTLYLLIFKAENWVWLVLFFVAMPLLSALLFSGAKIPKMETPEKVSGVLTLMKSKTLWLCVICIFLGGASEVTMAQWSSGYLEQSLGIPKIFGDVFGVAMFSLTLGLGRTLYAKYGKNIEKVLFFSTVGATVCYIVATVSSVAIVGLIACALTGLCVSMLWPGSLIVSSDRIPQGGVFIYAMMAAGGDLGASIGPQLVGAITDVVKTSEFGIQAAQNLSISAEQFGMKAGMAVGTLFPLLAIVAFAILLKTKKKNNVSPLQQKE